MPAEFWMLRIEPARVKRPPKRRLITHEVLTRLGRGEIRYGFQQFSLRWAVDESAARGSVSLDADRGGFAQFRAAGAFAHLAAVPEQHRVHRGRYCAGDAARGTLAHPRVQRDNTNA